MNILLLFIGCFILYGKSKFFPEYYNNVGNLIKQNRQVALLFGYLFLFTSYILFSLKLGWGTGFIVYLMTLSLFYSLLVIVLPLNKLFIHVLSSIVILLIIFENYISNAC